jgi:hypothetical protein
MVQSTYLKAQRNRDLRRRQGWGSNGFLDTRELGRGHLCCKGIGPEASENPREVTWSSGQGCFPCTEEALTVGHGICPHLSPGPMGFSAALTGRAVCTRLLSTKTLRVHLPLPAGTHQVWWAWPPPASQLQWKALSPAPCPCPLASPPWPTHPTPLLLAKLSSPRQIETTRVTSCSPGGLCSLSAWRRAPCTLRPSVWRWHPVVALALQRLALECARRARSSAGPRVECSCPVLWAGSLSCVLCVPR